MALTRSLFDHTGVSSGLDLLASLLLGVPALVLVLVLVLVVGLEPGQCGGDADVDSAEATREGELLFSGPNVDYGRRTQE